MNKAGLLKYLVPLVFLLILVVVLTNSTFITINAGEKGVLFKKFGGGLVLDKVYDQGFHVVAPWNEMFKYDVRYHEDFEEMKVLSKNGLEIKLEMSYRYKPMSDKIGYLHDEVGKNYLAKIIVPEIRSATREIIGKYLPEELYSSKREAIQDEIYAATQEAISTKYILCDAVLIRDVELPKTLQEAIERKLEQEQESLEYEFRLQKAQKEAERVLIEAKGKAEAYDIINSSLTDRILKEKGIEATAELSNSPNSKVVVIGGGKDGLPLILGNN